MSKHFLAAHATELPAGADGAKAPEWVHLLPYGTFHGRDGRGPYTLRDQAHAAQVIANTRKTLGSGAIPGDFDHQLLYSAQNGRPAPASGWIKELEARADGIWGRVDWTAAAADAIAGREYRYLSPVFGHDKAGTVMRIRAFALTNMPNLELTALASQSFSESEEEPMNETQFKALLKALGLSESTTLEALTAHCQQLDQAAKAAKTSLAAIAASLGQPEHATGEAIAAAAQEIAGKAKATDPDPAKFVPMASFKDLQDRVAAMSQQLSGDKAAKAIADAKSAGKLAPAMEDWAKGYATKDLDGFTAWCAQAPVIVDPSGTGTATATPPAKTDATGLTAEETAACKQLGITADAFLETKKKQTA